MKVKKKKKLSITFLINLPCLFSRKGENSHRKKDEHDDEHDSISNIIVLFNNIMFIVS